jgi:hypothetical protein
MFSNKGLNKKNQIEIVVELNGVQRYVKFNKTITEILNISSNYYLSYENNSIVRK